MTQANTSTSQVKSVKNPSPDKPSKKDGSQNKERPYLDIVDRAMAAHPGLTREEAERMLEELGY